MRRFGFVALFLLVVNSPIFAEGTWNLVTHAAGQEIGYVWYIATGIDTTLWVASENGIFWYKDSIWNYEDRIARDICVSQNGDVWFSYYNIFYLYDGENWETINSFDVYGSDNETTNLRGMGVDANGILWCCSLNGVYRYDGETSQKFTSKDGIILNSFSLISVSPEGEVWGRYGSPFCMECARNFYGVTYYNGETWETFNEENGLVGNTVLDIAFGPDGSVYVSQDPISRDPAISKYDGSSWEVVARIAGYLRFDPEGYLWVTNSWSRVVYKYDLTSRTIIEHYYPVDFSRDPAFDDEGRTWLGYRGLLVLDTSTGITDESISKPEEFIQLSNFPNPFNPITEIRYTLPADTKVTLRIYNILGQEVAVLVDNELIQAGWHTKVWDSRDVFGNNAASGIYFCRLTAGEHVMTQKIMLAR